MSCTSWHARREEGPGERSQHDLPQHQWMKGEVTLVEHREHDLRQQTICCGNVKCKDGTVSTGMRMPMGMKHQHQ